MPKKVSKRQKKKEEKEFLYRDNPLAFFRAENEALKKKNAQLNKLVRKQRERIGDLIEDLEFYENPQSQTFFYQYIATIFALLGSLSSNVKK